VWNAAYCRPTFNYSELGSPLQVTTEFGYDDFGNVVGAQVTGYGMPTRSTSAIYADATYTTGQFPLSEKNALNQTSTSEWDYDLGVPASFTDANGIAISWGYDPFGRRNRETRPDGTETTWTILSCSSISGSLTGPNHKTGVIARLFDTTGLYVTDSWVCLDAFDRPALTSTRLVSGGFNRVDSEYDSLGRLFRVSAPCRWGACTNYWVTNSYDIVDRLTQVSRPFSDSDLTLQFSHAYYEGLTTRAVDAQTKQSTRVVNAHGQLARSQDHDGYYQAFDYDAFSAPKRVQDSAGNTLQSSTYNVRGMLTARTDMDMGSWSFTPNALGETVSQTDAKNQTTTFEFDLLGRLKKRIEPEGVSEWIWDASSEITNIGRLTSVTGPGYSETYKYDSLGRPMTTWVSADASYQIDYSYNDIGALDSLTYPTSTNGYRFKLKYEYQFGQPYRIRDFADTPTPVNYWTANATNARGQITKETLGNNLITSRNYDWATGLMGSIQTGLNEVNYVQDYSYEWDSVGNLKKRKDKNQSSLTEEFFYDNLHRLDYSQRNGVTNLEMAYDAMGNVDSKSDVGSYTYHATKKHQVASTSNGWSFGYDGNGNMTSGRGRTISWTSYNYPICVTSGTDCTGTTSDYSKFSYAPNRQYWKQQSNFTSGGSATTIYIGNLLEKVSTSTGDDYRHHIRAGGSTIIVSRRTAGPNPNNTYYVTSDHLGSASAITDGSGNTLVNESFDAFGKRRGSTWSGSPSGADWTAIASTTRRGYTDHSMLDNLELIHMNGRVQDSLLGKLVSPDPYMTDPFNTQNYNRYSYVDNNPATFSDPSGFSPCYTVAISGLITVRPSTSATAPLLNDLPTILVNGIVTPTYQYCPPDTPTGRPLPPMDPPQSPNNPSGDLPSQGPIDQCWSGADGDWKDGVGGFFRELGNDGWALGMFASGMSVHVPGVDALRPFGSNNTSAGLLGGDLAPAAVVAGTGLASATRYAGLNAGAQGAREFLGLVGNRSTQMDHVFFQSAAGGSSSYWNLYPVSSSLNRLMGQANNWTLSNWQIMRGGLARFLHNGGLLGSAAATAAVAGDQTGKAIAARGGCN